MKLKGINMLLLAALSYGGYWVSQNYDLKSLANLKFSPRDGQSGGLFSSGSPPARDGNSIRVASFNIQVFGESKLDKPDVMKVLAEVVRRFDVVAIQEVRAKTQDVLPHFVSLINQTGRRYDYVIGPRIGRTNSKEQYAYIFDTASLELDRQTVYTVNDPNDRLHREPFVAWFRVRGPPANEAFTFTLVNIHTDPDDVSGDKNELDALADVFRAVRNDGRDEDDVILLGDLNVDDRHLGELGQLSGISWAISGQPTNTRGTQQYDNIVFQRQATVEYTGKSGVFDLVREFNLTTDQALEVSDHFPIWAEFSIYEGGSQSRVAARPGGAK